ncbi:MAG: TraR/DksA C4-type zinc finger protein [Parcubacteria group bacterium]|jgi:DnaK suppressor protein
MGEYKGSLSLFYKKGLLHAVMVMDVSNDAIENVLKEVFNKSFLQEKSGKHRLFMPDGIVRFTSTMRANIVDQLQAVTGINQKDILCLIDENERFQPKRSAILRDLVPCLKKELSECNQTIVDTQAEIGVCITSAEPNEQSKLQELRIASSERNNKAAKKTQKICATLRRVDIGIFGTCLDCDNEIDIYRLVAHPTATLCIECREKQGD